MNNTVQQVTDLVKARPLLIAAFQCERFYRAYERRWRELARTAELAIALADFERPRIRGQQIL